MEVALRLNYIFWLCTSLTATALCADQAYTEEEEIDPLQAILSDLDDVDTLWEEQDNYLFEDPLLPAFDPYIFSYSIAPGIGFSDNYLKDDNPSEAWFQQLEADIFYTAFPSDLWRFSTILFGKWIRYETDSDPASETIAFSQTSLTRIWESFSNTLKLTYVYGDQIYDQTLSPLLDPSTSRIQQQSIESALEFNWAISQNATFSITPTGTYTFFGDSDLDFASAGTEVGFNLNLSENLSLDIKLSFSREFYQSDPGRLANGSSSNFGALILDKTELEGEVEYAPFDFFPLKFFMNTTGEWTEDNGGGYDEYVSLKFSGGVSIEFSKLTLSAKSSIRDIDYHHRTTSFLGTETLDQRRDSMTLQARYELPLNFELSSEFNWTDSFSEIEEDSYKEKSFSISILKSF